MMAIQTDLLLCVAYDLSTDKLTFDLFFLKPASAPDAQHKDSTSLIDPCEACSEWNPSWKTSVWPWPQYFQGVTEFLIA